MRRGFWFVAGVGAGMYAVTRARRVAEAFTVDGVKDRMHGVGLGARLLREEYAAGAAATETALRERLGLVPDGTPELESATSARPAAITRKKDSN